MIATKNTRKLYWFKPEPYVQSQRWFEFVFLSSSALKSYNGVCKLRKRGRRSEVNKCPNEVFESPSPGREA
jgi:hypothetical protein